MTEKYSALVIEDSLDIAQQIAHFIEEKGFIVDFAYSGQQALHLLRQHTYDVIILDITLPDMDGLSICAHVKNDLTMNIPILMLTARDSLNDKIKGFRVGADDYLTKPFALEELFFRCMALCRRHRLHQSSTITIGELSIDINKHEVSRAGQTITLPATDFSLLKLLVDAYPNAISKRDLTKKIWGDNAPETDAIRSHIYTLRNAIDKPFTYPMIKTVHGIGFKLIVMNT